MARLDLAYDGTDFCGYARQPKLRTVQSEIEAALAVVFHMPIETHVAGRTDAGVHARQQVVSFTAPRPVTERRVVGRLNRIVPPDLVVLAASDTEPDFHARFSAKSRTYRYRILNAPLPDPVLRRTQWHLPNELDLESMNGAVTHLLGQHDFSSLCRRSEDRSRERTVLSAEWRRSGDLVEFSVTAVAFCHQMVRSMVALSVDVGIGKKSSADVPAILAARDRNVASGAAPPQGLTLWSVEY
jgi:tRNA pseudouridine38-40 synthase